MAPIPSRWHDGSVPLRTDRDGRPLGWLEIDADDVTRLV